MAEICEVIEMVGCYGIDLHPVEFELDEEEAYTADGGEIPYMWGPDIRQAIASEELDRYYWITVECLNDDECKSNY